VPDELFVSNISARATTVEETALTSLLAPTFDGQETSYFEWLCAGMHEARGAAATMHQVHRHHPFCDPFASDSARHLCIRLTGRGGLLICWARATRSP
jgi:hypothetical protein